MPIAGSSSAILARASLAQVSPGCQVIKVRLSSIADDSETDAGCGGFNHLGLHMAEQGDGGEGSHILLLC